MVSGDFGEAVCRILPTPWIPFGGVTVLKLHYTAIGGADDRDSNPITFRMFTWCSAVELHPRLGMFGREPDIFCLEGRCSTRFKLHPYEPIGSRTQTNNLCLATAPLYQLSYTYRLNKHNGWDSIFPDCSKEIVREKQTERAWTSTIRLGNECATSYTTSAIYNHYNGILSLVNPLEPLFIINSHQILSSYRSDEKQTQQSQHTH